VRKTQCQRHIHIIKYLQAQAHLLETIGFQVYLAFVSELILIYDGECGFCKKWVDWIRKRDKAQQLEYLPCQSNERKQRFPQINEMDCLKAMHVVLSDGPIFSGADAAPHILRALPGWQWCAAMFKIPGALLVARPVYRSIARNRHRFGSETDHCKL